ncbi:hypothetical protein OIV83_003347 [Microbotryomycetes sp. JL201]|nr:hypothetical protein OIV83_003347 [Microbotryomycetes sp. JL201]
MSYENRHMASATYKHRDNTHSSADMYDSVYPTRSAADPFADTARAATPSAYPPLPYHAYDAPSRDSLSGGAWEDDGHDAYGVPRGATNYGGQDAQEKYYAESVRRRTKGNKVKLWTFIALAVLVIIGIGVGIGVWRATANAGSGSNGSSKSETSSGGLQYIEGTAKAVKSDPNDPANFEKDSALSKSFWGLCYTPFLAQEPWCGATLANVTEDVQIMSQLTPRLRMYGSACNQSQLVLQAIQDTKVDMTVWLGAWVSDNATVNEQQQDWIVDAINAYGTDHVAGVVVGNEYLLNAADKASAVDFVLGQVSSMRSKLAALNLPKQVPVGTGDAGSEFTQAVANGVDFMMANIHPFFGGLVVDQAAQWTWQFAEWNDVPLAQAAPNKPTVYIAETGWASDSMTAENRTYEGAVAGVPELQTFLDTYVCAANANGSQYFYFGPWDEPWKEMYGGVEPYWGLFNSDKVLKPIKLPTCLTE